MVIITTSLLPGRKADGEAQGYPHMSYPNIRIRKGSRGILLGKGVGLSPNEITLFRKSIYPNEPFLPIKASGNTHA